MTADGTVEFVLDNAGSGMLEPFAGGEINSYATATTGTFSWTAQAPQMVDGAVFGLFGYNAQQNEPWLEFNSEWARPNTNEVHLTVHMADATGKRVTSIEKTVVDLGFDAAAGSTPTTSSSTRQALCSARTARPSLTSAARTCPAASGTRAR